MSRTDQVVRQLENMLREFAERWTHTVLHFACQVAEPVWCWLQDYWLSIDRYINWSSTASGKNDFYTDYQCRQMYKQHLYTFTHRKNTVNGRIYREDPTIFYWDLINEPRWWAPVLCWLAVQPCSDRCRHTGTQ